MNLTRKILTTTLYAIPLFLVTASVVMAQGAAGAVGAAANEGLQLLLWTFVNNVFGWLAGVAGVLLDYSINEYIVGFGKNFLGGTAGGGAGTGATGVAVDLLWSNVRDFFNLTFIFGLVYLGFKMILNSDDSSTRKWLVSLIMAALLVNFSLFITKFIVDLSNILASQIYGAGFTQSISTTFMRAFGITAIFDDTVINKVPGGAGTGASAYTYIFGSAIVFLIAAFVFFAGAIMIMIRYAVLILYMILSPLMFLGWVFPQLQSVSSKYWSGFLGKAFFAPIYILMLLFAATVMGELYGGGGNAPFSQALIGSNIQQGVEAALPPFIIASIFLIAAVVIANKMGADGASQAIKIGNNLRGRGQRFVTRNTVGLGAYGVSYAGRAASKGVNRLDEVSNRNRLTRFTRGAVNTATLGATSHTVLKGAAEAASKASIAGSRTAEQYTKDERERKNTRDKIKTNAENKTAIDRALELDRKQRSGTTLSPAELGELAAGQAAANRLSAKDLTEMAQTEKGLKRVASISHFLQTGTLGKIGDSDDLSPEDKKAIFGAYEEKIKETITENGQVVTAELAKLSIKQLEILGDEFIRENIEYFNEEQMDGLKKSDSFIEPQKELYKKLRKDTYTGYQAASAGLTSDNNFESMFRNVSGGAAATPVGGGATFNIKTFATGQKRASEIAKLPVAVLSDARALPFIDGSVLEEIVSKKTLTPAERITLTANLVTRNPATGAITALPGANPDAVNYLRSSAGQRNYF